MDRLRRVEGASSSGGAPAASKTGGSPNIDRETLHVSESTGSPAPAERLAENPAPGVLASKPDVRAAAGLPYGWMLAGFLVICAVFLVWRPWKERPSGDPGTGRRLAEGSAEVAGAAEEPREAITGQVGRPVAAESDTLSRAGPSENGLSTGSGGSQRKTDPGAAEERAPRSNTGDVLAGEAQPRLGGAVLQQEVHPEHPVGSPLAGHPEPDAAVEPEAASEGSDIPSRKPVVSALGTGATAEQVLTPQEDQRTKTFLLNLKVAGVYRDADGCVALINGRAFQKGDRIGQVDILEIASERVTFGYKGKRYLLPIR
jgi:hypothetical protein